MTLEQRLWRRVIKTESCWEWQGARDVFGYGVIGRGRRGEGNVLAHRGVWELTYGSVPEGMCVLHRCDNPPCVNPAHLWLGTRDDNNKDMATKGRHAMRQGTYRAPTGDDHWMRRHPKEEWPKRDGNRWIRREA